MENYTEQELIRREKAEKLRELGIDPFGQRFERKDWWNSKIQSKWT